MKMGLAIGAAATFLGYMVGYGRGMSYGVQAARDAWGRAVRRDENSRTVQ